MKLESGSMGLLCVKNPLLRRLWNCRMTNYEIVIDIANIVAYNSQIHARAILLIPSSLNGKCTFLVAPNGIIFTKFGPLFQGSLWDTYG
jgi:hypothetical protein